MLPKFYEVFQCYIANITNQYWLGMGFSNVNVYADEFSVQYVLWTLYGSIVQGKAIFYFKQLTTAEKIVIHLIAELRLDIKYLAMLPQHVRYHIRIGTT